MLTYSLGDLLKEITFEENINEKVNSQSFKKKSKKTYTKVRTINDENLVAKMIETESNVQFIQNGISLDDFQRVGNEYIFEEEYYGEDYAFYIDLRFHDISKIFEVNDSLVTLEGNLDNIKITFMATNRDKKTGLHIIKKGTGVMTYLCKFRTQKSNIPIKASYITNKKEKYYPSTRNVAMPSKIQWGIMHPYQGGQFMPK